MDAEDIEEGDLERFEENEDEVEGDDEQEGAAEENETADDDSSKKTVKPKKVVRNPQPKLNAETLKGKRGLIALESYFERVKFKGRGHEEEDLSVILKTYEYWCHRLFPKYPFDECISKIEGLGKKKPVVTYIKRLRADLPYDYGPEIINENNSEDEDVTNNEVNNYFDQLSATPEMQVPSEVSEEQLERIRLNKERAERIRREKLRQEKELAETMLNETNGSQIQCSSQISNTEFLCEEAISETELLETQIDEPINNPEENTNILPAESDDLEENLIPELQTHERREIDCISGAESGNDLEEKIACFSNEGGQ